MKKEKKEVELAVEAEPTVIQISTVEQSNYGWHLFRLYSDGKVTKQSCDGFKEPKPEEEII